MRALILVICLFFLLPARADFFANTDIPMMDEMRVNELDTFSFDTPAGQIMNFSGTISVPVKEVEAFYQDSLLALGWQAQSKTEYVRDQDKLVLKISPRSKGTELRLQLTYKNK